MVAGQRDVDPVGLDLGDQIGHVAHRRRLFVEELVLDLIQDHVTAARDLVRGDDRVHLRQPLFGGRDVVGGVGPRHALLGHQPTREAAGVGLGVDVRARASDHVQPGLLSVVEERVDVTNAREVVDAGRGGAVVPVEVRRHGVEPVGLHLLEPIEPQRWRRRPPRIEFTGVDHRPFAADHQRVLVVADALRLAEQDVARRRDRRRRDGVGVRRDGAARAGRVCRDRERVGLAVGQPVDDHVVVGYLRGGLGAVRRGDRVRRHVALAGGRRAPGHGHRLIAADRVHPRRSSGRRCGCLIRGRHRTARRIAAGVPGRPSRRPRCAASRRAREASEPWPERLMPVRVRARSARIRRRAARRTTTGSDDQAFFLLGNQTRSCRSFRKLIESF